MFKKNRVICIIQTQSVTLFFLHFDYPHELQSRNKYNKQLYTSWLAYIETSKFKIEKNTQVLTGSRKYTENRWPKIILKNE